MTTVTIGEFLMGLLPKFGILMAVVILDLVGGIAVAWQTGKFTWEKLPEFLKTFVSYLYAWLTAEIIGFLFVTLGLNLSGFWELFAEYSGETVLAGILIKYGASIIGHLQTILGRPSSLLAKAGLPPTGVNAPNPYIRDGRPDSGG